MSLPFHLADSILASNEMIGSLTPMFAAEASGNAITFAWKHLTSEGLSTIVALLIVSVFSWTVMISKARQLIRASRMGKKFFAAYRETRDPMDIFKNKQEFDGAPAYEVYMAGAEEVAYHLKNNPVQVQRVQSLLPAAGDGQDLGVHTDMLARSTTTKISAASFDSVRVAMERAASTEAMALEKGMIILCTAVAGGPFIGLFGTVWGVMETFSGIGRAGAASLTVMAPGVAAALLATVAGLSVAIPAMFAYNYMVTTIRAITQELDGFSSEYATQLEHTYVDTRPLAEEIRDALAFRAPEPTPGPVNAAAARPVPQPALAG